MGRLNTDICVGRGNTLSTGVAELMGTKHGGTGGHLVLENIHREVEMRGTGRVLIIPF